MCGKLGRSRLNRRDKRQKERKLAFAEGLYYRFGKRLPVKEGEVIKVKVTETSVDNVGIARVGLFKINIPKSKMGEELKVMVRRVTDRGAIAEIVDDD